MLKGKLKALREQNKDLKRKLSHASHLAQLQRKSLKEYIKDIVRLKVYNYMSSKVEAETRAG